MTNLADAMEHAHVRGVLHRDLKPGNILLMPKESLSKPDPLEPDRTEIEPATLVPRITDFGLAKLESSEVTATRTGSLLGTAAYMAPEQVEGRTNQIDRRTDVYGLGAILYELVAGRPIFSELTSAATLLAVRQQDPIAPRTLRQNVPADLEAICLKCLEKDPAKRYETASELTADLQRFLAGEPTLARPIRRLQRGIRWAMRHRLLTAFIVLALVSLLGFTAGGAWHIVRLRSELETSDHLRTEAQEREAKYHELLYAADMRLANQALLEKDVTRATQLLDAHVPTANDADYRDLEWYVMERQAVGEHAVVDEVCTPTYELALSPDGNQLATVGQDAKLRLYEWPSGKRIMEIATGQREINGVDFSEDSQTIATTGDDGSLKFWDRTSSPRTQNAHRGTAYGVAYSSQARAWFTGGEDALIRKWNAVTGTLSGELTGLVNR
jgi:hypothetical protein